MYWRFPVRLKSLACGVCLLAVSASLYILVKPEYVAHAAPAAAPAYATNGDMLPLAHYREWVYLTSGIDMRIP